MDARCGVCHSRRVTLDSPRRRALKMEEHARDDIRRVLNGFSGRLFNQVRSREGLVYSVSGGFAAGLDHPGTFVVSGQTSAPAKFVRAVTAVLDDATRVPLPAAELQRAKDKALNSFVFNFASKYEHTHPLAPLPLAT